MQVVRPELTADFHIVLIGRRRHSCNRNRIGFFADVENPGAFHLLLVDVHCRLDGHHQQVPVMQRQRAVGAAAVRGTPVAVNDQLWPGRVLHIQDGQTAVSPGCVRDVIRHHDRVVQRPAARPDWGFAGGGVHAGDPPAAGLARLCRVGHVNADQDMVDEIRPAAPTHTHSVRPSTRCDAARAPPPP